MWAMLIAMSIFRKAQAEQSSHPIILFDWRNLLERETLVWDVDKVYEQVEHLYIFAESEKQAR